MRVLERARTVVIATSKATPGEWVAFCKNGVLAVMSGRKPRRAQKKWKEIVKWAGFDGTDFPEQEADNLFSIVDAVNFARSDLPEMISEHEQMVSRITRLEEGLTLAANRLDRMTLEAPFDSAIRHECSEWAAAARSLVSHQEKDDDR